MFPGWYPSGQGDAAEEDAGWHLVSSLDAQEEVQEQQWVLLMCLEIRSCCPLGRVMTCPCFLHHPQQT